MRRISKLLSKRRIEEDLCNNCLYVKLPYGSICRWKNMGENGISRM
jgi:hypothetical protein